MLNKLQYVQNSAARILTSTHRSDHTPVLQDLHWLPVKYRIDFKILLITSKHSTTWRPPPSLTSSTAIPLPVVSGLPMPTSCTPSGPTSGPGETEPLLQPPPPSGKPSPTTSAMPTRFHLPKLPLKHTFQPCFFPFKLLFCLRLFCFFFLSYCSDSFPIKAAKRLRWAPGSYASFNESKSVDEYCLRVY